MIVPGSANPLLFSADDGYNLTRSLRFRSSASASLSRTPASAGNRQKWTWSGWIKRGALGTNNCFFSQGNNIFVARFNNNTDVLEVYDVTGGPYQLQLITSQVFRDPSAWYHLVIATDTTQATASNRVKIYLNGTQITAFSTSTYYSQNYNTEVNTTDVTNIGALAFVGQYFDGYLTEINFIDGQALTQSSFGETDITTGVWKPKRYAGTYGTNGFYLPFTDNSALTTSSNAGLGKDFSGNGNYWTTNNISITSGTTYDSMTDVPTLTSATAANFAVLNPLNAETGMGGTLGGGNLDLSGSGGKRSTIAARTGKWYWEFRVNSGAGANFPMSGLYVAGQGTYYPGYDGNSFGYFQGGAIYYNGSTSLTVSSYTDGDVLGFAWDADTGKVYVAKNGTWQNSGNPAAGTGQVATISTGVDRVVGAYNSSGSCSINFGQRPFAYTPPTGYVSLNTYNLPTSTILKGNTVMDATLYTGTLLSNAITNTAAFKPDLVWLKSRSAATGHEWTDSVRGVTKSLSSNSTAAEATDVQGLTAFNTNGFTVGTNTDYNNLAATYVAWQWQAGQGTNTTNTNGTITSTVSVNASAGFSVVSYTGTAVNATVGHGLGVAPSFIVVKRRVTAGFNWVVWHSALTGLQFLKLNSTDAVGSAATVWNSTIPTSSVFSLGSDTTANPSAEACIAYCWAPIAGYSAFGSYTGNGSTDGAFVYTGFRPKWVMIKEIGAGGTNWNILDTSRDPYNVEQKYLAANLSDAEGTLALLDGLSNGFKLRNSVLSVNASGNTYIYAAFAENPFKNSLAR